MVSNQSSANLTGRNLLCGANSTRTVEEPYVELSNQERAKYLLKKGDVLFNRTNSAELVGKTAVFDLDVSAIFASYIIRFKIDSSQADPRYVSSYINSKRGKTFIERHMTRAIGQVNISASTMHEMMISVPSLAQQLKIMNEMEKKLQEIDLLKTQLEVEGQVIKSLPKNLMCEAFSGAI